MQLPSSNWLLKIDTYSGIIQSYIDTSDVDCTIIYIIRLMIVNLYFVSQLHADIVCAKTCNGIIRQAVYLLDHLRCSVFVVGHSIGERAHSLFHSPLQIDHLDLIGARCAMDGDQQHLDQKQNRSHRHVGWLQCLGRERRQGFCQAVAR